MTARKVEDHVEIGEEDVRAGQTGLHVRYILIASVALAIMAMWAVSALN